MRMFYAQIFKAFIHRELYKRRKELNMIQEKMASKLEIALRTYVDIEHGKNGCNGLTLAFFLLYICEDPVKFLEDLRHEFEVAVTETA